MRNSTNLPTRANRYRQWETLLLCLLVFGNLMTLPSAIRDSYRTPFPEMLTEEQVQVVHNAETDEVRYFVKNPPDQRRYAEMEPVSLLIANMLVGLAVLVLRWRAARLTQRSKSTPDPEVRPERPLALSEAIPERN